MMPTMQTTTRTAMSKGLLGCLLAGALTASTEAGAQPTAVPPSPSAPPAAVPPGADGAATAAAPGEAAPAQASVGAAGGLPGQGVAGIILAASGVVVAGLGIGVGIAARADYDESEPHCIDEYCDPEGLAIRDEAINQANIATLLFAVGGVAVTGGIVLWVTASSTDEATQEPPGRRIGLRLRPTGVVITGKW